MKHFMIAVGNFFFTWRNKTFPLIIVALYLFFSPPHEFLGKESLEAVKDIVALAAAIAGLCIRAITIGYAYIKRGGLNKKVYAESLVTQGMFSLCRNPLYFGNIMIYSGVFLMHGDPIVTLIGTGLYLFIYQCIIYAEEDYLQQKFGDSYARYCQEVPRWLPRLHRYHAAVEGMEFSLKRVIVKDYTTIATTIMALSLTEMYEYLSLHHGLETHSLYVAILAGVILISGIWVASVRFYKKKVMV